MDTDYFPAGQAFMLNLRVSDLDGLLAGLRGAGSRSSPRRNGTRPGRFARIHDPEGNAVELWEPGD
jgi:predicted enzyme related to lactoylglutathione lyase